MSEAKKLPAAWKSQAPEITSIVEIVNIEPTPEELDLYPGFLCGSCGSLSLGLNAGPRSVKLVCHQCTSNTLKPLFSPGAELTAKKYGLDLEEQRARWSSAVAEQIYKDRQEIESKKQAHKRKMRRIYWVGAFFLGFPFYLVLLADHPKTMLLFSAVGVAYFLMNKINQPKGKQ